VRHVLLLRVGRAESAGLRVLRRLRVVGVAMALQRRWGVELLLGLVILCGRVSVAASGRADASAYASAIGVRGAIAGASIWVRLTAVSSLGLAIRVAAVLIVVLRHVWCVLGWIGSVGAMVSECRSGAGAWRTAAEATESCAD
jgi:hypothetical protein